MKIRDLIPTLTGFEEIGIEQVCGKSLEELTDSGTKEHPKPMRDLLLARVMGAVLFARAEKVTLGAAWAKVLALPQSELADLFEDDEDDVEDMLEDDPDTEAGKGDSETVSVLTS